MNKLYNHVLSTSKKYMITLSAFSIATVIMMITIYSNDDPSNENNMRLIMTFIYGGILATLITSMIDYLKYKYKQYLYGLVPVLMLIVYFIIVPDINVSSNGLKFMMLCLLTILPFFVMPFLCKKEDSDYYTFKVLLSLLIVQFSYLVLVIGILLTLYATSTLFEFSLPEYLYPEIMTFIMGFIAPIAFLSLINVKIERKEYPAFIRGLLSYIIIPLLDVYTFILYAYFVKVLLAGELPSNMLGNLIVPYAIVSVFVLYFMQGIKKGRVIDLYIKIYPYLLIMPMLMMIYSIVIRVNEYGITEGRYYGILLAIFVLGTAFILKRFKVVKYIPLLLAGLLLISIADPISAGSVSKFSQSKRLELVLKRNDMLVNEKIVPAKNISYEDRKLIADILDYYQYNHELKDLKLLPAKFDMIDMETVFGFPYPQDVIYLN